MSLLDKITQKKGRIARARCVRNLVILGVPPEAASRKCKEKSLSMNFLDSILDFLGKSKKRAKKRVSRRDSFISHSLPLKFCVDNLLEANRKMGWDLSRKEAVRICRELSKVRRRAAGGDPKKTWSTNIGKDSAKSVESCIRSLIRAGYTPHQAARECGTMLGLPRHKYKQNFPEFDYPAYSRQISKSHKPLKLKRQKPGKRDHAIPVYVERGRLESPRSGTFGLGPSPRSQKPTKDGYCWRVSYDHPGSGNRSQVVMQAWTPGDVKKKFESRLSGYRILNLEQIDTSECKLEVGSLR